MPTENDFLPFACGASANVETQSAWAGDAVVTNGFQSGTANSVQVNKVLRQASIMASMLAQFIVDNSGQPALDNGTTATLEANLKAAINALIALGLVPYAPLNSPALTGNPTAPTQATSDNSVHIATTAWVINAVASGLYNAGFASLNAASANLTTLITNSPATGDSSNHVPNTSWVTAALSSAVAPLAPESWVISLFAQLSSFGANYGTYTEGGGYQKLPGGLTIQWGGAGCGGSSSGDQVFYNLTFPNAALAVLGCDDGGGGHVVSCQIINSAYFLAYCRGNNTSSFAVTNIRWFAIGW